MTEFEISKCDNIIDYFEGTYHYTEYLLERFNENNKKVSSKELLKKENQNSCLVSFISTILLSIKEDIIENKGDLNYESKLLFNSLEKSVNLIATKQDNGYLLGNTLLPNAPEVVHLIRNKIAHGEFILNLSSSKIYLHKDSNYIELNIDKLTKFILSALTEYNRNIEPGIYRRRLLINEKVDPKRKAPVLKTKELVRIMSNMKELNISIRRKDNKNIDELTAYTLDYAVNEYYKTHDINVFKKLSIALKEEFIIDYTKLKVKDFGFDKLATSFLKKLRPGTIYKDEMYAIEEYMVKNLNTKEKNSHLIAIQNNIKHILAIKETKTLDFLKLEEYFYKFSPSTIYGTEELSSSLVSMFTTLFCYPLDDIYANKNDIDNEEINGLDFSLLDLSKINVLSIDKTPGKIKEVISVYNARLKDKTELTDTLKKCRNQLEKLNEKGLTDKIILIEEKINKTLLDIRAKDNEIKSYQTILNIYNKNSKYYYNLAIINGIRNSIAHGHYTYSLDETFETSKIHFKDIYEGELTFECEVLLGDFLHLQFDNIKTIGEYLLSINAKTKTI